MLLLFSSFFLTNLPSRDPPRRSWRLLLLQSTRFMPLLLTSACALGLLLPAARPVLPSSRAPAVRLEEAALTPQGK